MPVHRVCRGALRGNLFSRLGLEGGQGVVDPFPGRVMAAIFVFTGLDQALEPIGVLGDPGLEGVFSRAF